jgi:polyvinyl alcohol dehydrogenase (cytochrome)
MQVQGASLSDAERRAIAQFLTGRAPAASRATAVRQQCTTSPAMTDAATTPGWNGWGNGVANTRFAANAGLTAADLPRLKLKWAFGYAGVNAARAQPTIAGGRLFVASENGEAHALDPKTGCTHWTYKAQAGIRTGMTVGPYKTASGSGQAVYFGDVKANAYALDAETGRELWVRKVEDHVAASLTGAPTVSGGKVFVPVQGLNEEGQGGTGKYACCTFRGSLVALDANTGAVLWKTYTVDAPQPRGKNAAGIQMFGTRGRRDLVVAYGGYEARPRVRRDRNAYADPPQK